MLHFFCLVVFTKKKHIIIHSELENRKKVQEKTRVTKKVLKEIPWDRFFNEKTKPNLLQKNNFLIVQEEMHSKD